MQLFGVLQPVLGRRFPGELHAVLKRLRETDGSELRPATEKFNGRLKRRSRVNSDA